MSDETAKAMERWLKAAQFGVALIALIGAMIYAGQRSERDEEQTRSLGRIAEQMGQIQSALSDGNAQIRVLNVRVGVLEDRVGRIERK